MKIEYSMALSLRSHSDQGVATELPLRSVAIIRGFLVGDCLRFRGASTAFIAIPRRFHGVVGYLTALLWRSYGARINTPRNGVCFDAHLTNAVPRRSVAFYAISPRCQGDPTALLQTVLRSPRHSTIFKTPWDRRESATIL